jgi:hypothetical protein
MQMQKISSRGRNVTAVFFCVTENIIKFLARVFDRPFLLFAARRHEHGNVQISGEIKNREKNYGGAAFGDGVG